MKVIIAGDRECDNFDLIESAVKQSSFEITEVVSGGARGADSVGELWAKVNKIPIKVFKADWNNIKTPNAIVKSRQNPWTKKQEKYNANAGFQRNEEMAKYAEALIALQPNGPTNGTQHMIKMAKKYNLKVHIYEKAAEDYEYEF
jgi:hypothetical protein